MSEEKEQSLEDAIYQAQNNNIISLHWATLTAEKAKRMAIISQHAQIRLLYFARVQLQSGSIEQLKRGRWDSLIKLMIHTKENNLTLIEFEDLTSISMKNLETVGLTNNSIDEDHCLLLAASDWPIINLNLSLNMIYAEHCKIIADADWKMQNLNLSWNSVDAEGVSFLAQAGWKNLTHLNLDNNSIGEQGCKNIIRARWQYLKQLELEKNQINEVGCLWLSKGQWMNLKLLNLNENHIGFRGILNLAACKWPQLATLSIRNGLGLQGIYSLLNCQMDLVYLTIGEKDVADEVEPIIKDLITSKYSDSIQIRWNWKNL